MAVQQDTIFALSTPPGRGGIAVFRLSGPLAGEALRRIGGGALPEPRRAVLRSFRDPENGELIDRGLALWFPGPASFTGENLAELHIHGGRAVVAAATTAFAAMPGLRVAEPGEFTRRAFDAGKLDLAEVEGLADLIAAETEAQRRVALRQLSGALSQVVEGWRQRLLEISARLEAWIDFPEEGLPEQLAAEVDAQIAALLEEMRPYLGSARMGERLREGLTVAILGVPNVGKSSLINALARRDVAIVSEIAGTTRDVIEVHLDLRGYPVTLADTAGLRTDGDEVGAIEAEGMARARARAEDADLKLVVLDASAPLAAQTAGLSLLDDRSLLVMNKSDLPPAGVEESSAAGRLSGVEVVAVSATTGAGLGALLDRLSDRAEALLGLSGIAAPLTRARHATALSDCISALGQARAADLPELQAEDLRFALRALGRVTGRVDVEDLLDVIFGEFCIGK